MTAKKVLLADDSDTSRMMGKMILSRTSYQLIIAKDGDEAVEKARSEKPDLILMDVMMPRMNGFEAVRLIREVDELADIPIIMVTTRGEEENVRKGFENGCNDYITKPINGVELLSKIRTFLDE